jgi:hypothetical protein
MVQRHIAGFALLAFLTSTALTLPEDSRASSGGDRVVSASVRASTSMVVACLDEDQGWLWHYETQTWYCDGGTELCEEDVWYAGLCGEVFEIFPVIFACEAYGECDGSGDSQNESCGDERDPLIAQYDAYSVGFTPYCWDFMNGASYPANNLYARYPFISIRSPDAPWAIVQSALTVPYPSIFGLDRMVQVYGDMFGLNSVYRTPQHNASVGGAQYSRHMFGDAIDAAAGTQAIWDALKVAAETAYADYIEPLSQSGVGHVHADWRAH